MRENVITFVVVLSVSVIGLVIIFMAVSSRSTKPLESAQVGAFVVETLFTHDGITVYRFYDEGGTIYFASRGGTSWSEHRSTGKVEYTVDRNVMTVEEYREPSEKEIGE